MNRRRFIRLASVSAGTAASGQAFGLARRPSRPNIIFIMADDLGYGHLGCYGQKKIMTPNIDRLAKEGVKFTDFYAGYTVCAPSRSVLMTGLHHGHTPVRSNSGSSSLLENEITLSQVLHDAGYAIGGFGKWGLGIEGTPGRPAQKGFDEFYGFYHQVHGHFYYPYWIWHNDEKYPLPGNENSGRGQWVEDVLHEKAVEFIRSRAGGKQPFFCYIPSIIPHVELAVPEESAKPYRGKFPKQTINDGRKGYLGSDDAYAVYAGMITRLDGYVGRIMELLKELGVDDNTIVFFTGDNGPQGGPWEPLNEFFNGAGPLSGSKGSLLEGGIRVPFVARWPGRIRPGSVSDHIGGFQDMMATFSDLAGGDPPPNDGVSIVPTLLGQTDRQDKHPYLFWGGKQQAVRMGKWKGLRTEKEPWQLFDLSKDIGETTDLAEDYPDIVKKIDQYAAEAYTEPRKQSGGTRVGIEDYVSADRITTKNAR
jgi:arylsulfatase A